MLFEVNKMKIANLTKWQNYAHYLLLTIALYIALDLDGANSFVLTYAVLFLADTIVHFIFSILPGKLRWKD